MNLSNFLEVFNYSRKRSEGLNFSDVQKDLLQMLSTLSLTGKQIDDLNSFAIFDGAVIDEDSKKESYAVSREIIKAMVEKTNVQSLESSVQKTLVS